LRRERHARLPQALGDARTPRFDRVADPSAAFGLLPAPAVGGDDIAAGSALVETHCIRCQVTGDAGESSLAAAPRFRGHLHDDVALGSESFVEGTATGHPDMQWFAFDPGQAEAIIAYLKSLAR
jgi:cytochrome c